MAGGGSSRRLARPWLCGPPAGQPWLLTSRLCLPLARSVEVQQQLPGQGPRRLVRRGCGSAVRPGNLAPAAGVRGLQTRLRYFTVAGATHHKREQHRSNVLQSWESEVQNQSELKSRWAGLVPAEAPGSLALASVPPGAPALLGSRRPLPESRQCGVFASLSWFSYLLLPSSQGPVVTLGPQVVQVHIPPQDPASHLQGPGIRMWATLGVPGQPATPLLLGQDLGREWDSVVRGLLSSLVSGLR